MPRVAVRAHAAGVRARIAVEDRFVILASGASGRASRPSHSAMKLTSSPVQKLLDHQAALQRGEGSLGLRARRVR